MIQLNLLPDVKKEFLKAQSYRSKTIVVSIFVTLLAIAAVVILSVWVFVVQPVRQNYLSDEIENRTAEMNKIADLQKYVNLQNRLNSIDSYHAKKSYYSRLFEVLPKLNPSEKPVKLTSVHAVKEDGSVEFMGEVADFNGLETFEDTLANAVITYQTDGAEKAVNAPLFVKIEPSTASLNASNNNIVVFTIKASINPELLLRDNKNITVSVPSQNTTGSVVDSPSIFDDQKDNETEQQ